MPRGRYLQDDLPEDEVMLITSINGGADTTFYPPQAAVFVPPQTATVVDSGYLEVSPINNDEQLAAKLQAEEFAAAGTGTYAAGTLGPAVIVPAEVEDCERPKPSCGAALCYGLVGVLTLFWVVCAMLNPEMISAEQVLLDENNQPTDNGTVVAQGIWFTESCPTSATWRDAMESLNPHNNDSVCTVTSSCEGIMALENITFSGCDIQFGNCIAVRAVSIAIASICVAGSLLAMGTAKCWCCGKLSRWAFYLAALLGFCLAIQYMVVVYTCGFTAGPGTESVAELGYGYYNFVAASSWCLIVGLLVPGPSKIANDRRQRTAVVGMIILTLICIVSWI